jgi:hypothetical protein
MWMEFQSSSAEDMLEQGIDSVDCSYVCGGIPISYGLVPPLIETRALPLRVLWRGFVVNWLIYASVWAVLAMLFARTRQRGGKGET